MWSLLQLHAKGCQATECPVPRCRELREMRRRQIARAEDQRRVGYQAMLRNQAGASSRAPSAPLPPGAAHTEHSSSTPLPIR